MKLTPQTIAEQVQALRLLYPDLPEDDEGWQLTVESETGLSEFITWLEHKRQESADMADAVTARINALVARRDRLKTRERMKRQLAFKLMQATGISKLELAEATYSLRPVVPSVIILDESKLPDQAFTITRTPNKTRIKDMLKTGTVSGATMSNGGQTLAIRT